MVALTLKEKYELKKASEVKNLDEGFVEKAKEIASKAGEIASSKAGIAGAIGAGVIGVSSLVGIPFLAGAVGAGTAAIMSAVKMSGADLKKSEAKWEESIKALEKLNQIQVPDSLPALKKIFTNFDQKIAKLLATERSEFNKLLFGKGDDSDRVKSWKTAWGWLKTDAGKMAETTKQIEDFDNKLQNLYKQIDRVIKAYPDARENMTIKQILDRETPPTS